MRCTRADPWEPGVAGHVEGELKVTLHLYGLAEQELDAS